MGLREIKAAISRSTDWLNVPRRSSMAAVDVLEGDLRSALVGPYTPRPAVQAAPPNPTYNSLADAEDRAQIQRAGQDLRQFNRIFVPVKTAGDVPGSPFDVDANGLMLLPRTMENGLEIESSETARIYIKINNESNPWIPMSFGLSAAGSKADAVSIGARINRIWIYVMNVTQDSDNQPYIVLSLLKAVSVQGGFGGSSNYGGAQQQSGQPTVNAGTVTAGSGSNSGAPGSVPDAPSGDLGGGPSPRGGGHPI